MGRKALTGLWATCVCLVMFGGVARAATGDIVLYASDASNIHGNWTRTPDSSAAGGQMMASADRGWSSTDNVLASPADYFEVSFPANAGTRYHVWLRLRAAGNSKYNDSVFAQFSDAVSPSGSTLFGIGTTSGLYVNLQSCDGCVLAGWGWLDGAYWLTQPSTLQFATSGTHTMRIQTREDGVQIDQIVLSPVTYLNKAPGPKLADSTIVPKPVTLTATPYTGIAFSIPGTIEAENFDNGGEGVAYHDTTASNLGGAYRQTGVDIEGASEGGYDVGWISAGEWLGYSVSVASAGSYVFSARVACYGPGGTFHLESGGVNLTGAMTIPDTGGWQSWTTVSKTVTLAAGPQSLKLVFDTAGPNAVGNVTWFAVTPAVSTPYNGTAIALPGSFYAVNFDNGGEGLAYHDTSAGNSGGAYRSTDVDIQPSTLGGNDVGWIDTGEWLAYSVNVASAGNYTIQLQVAGFGGAAHARFAGVDTAPVSIPNTGGWQNWTTVTLSASLGAGPQTMALVFDAPGFNVTGVTVAPVVVVSAPLTSPQGTGTSPQAPSPQPPSPQAPAPQTPAPQAPAPPTTPVTTGNVITVHAGDDLQAAIDRALSGDTIVLDAGATFTGNFMLPPKTGTDFVTIRSSAADSALPGATTRIDPTYAPQLPKLQSPNSSPALATEAGAHNYRLLALEFLPNPLGYYDMLDLGDGSSLQNTLASVPHDFIVDRVYMHGSPTVGQKRAISLNSAATTITNSYICEIKFPGQDSQAIGGWNGPGPYTITNNYLEAASENIMFGGSDPAIPNLVPSNITISGNYITKQVAWRGQNWGVKNSFELKNAEHVVITGNVIENAWVESQTGGLVVLTVRDQDGTAPWSTIQDVTFSNNVVRHGASFLSILGLDDDPVARPSTRMQNVHVTGNLIYDIDPQKWNDPSTGAWGLGRLVQIIGGPLNLDISHNTMLSSSPNASPNLNSAVALGQPGDTYKTEGLTIRNNVMAEGQYGVIGDGVGIGTIALDTFAPGWAFDDNLLIRGTSGGNYSYPATTTVNAPGVPVLDTTTFAVLPGFASTPTTDAKTVGADLSVLLSTISGLDLTK